MPTTVKGWSLFDRGLVAAAVIVGLIVGFLFYATYRQSGNAAETAAESLAEVIAMRAQLVELVEAQYTREDAFRNQQAEREAQAAVQEQFNHFRERLGEIESQIRTQTSTQRSSQQSSTETSTQITVPEAVEEDSEQ